MTASAAGPPYRSASSSSGSARSPPRWPDRRTALILSRAFMGIGGAFIMPATLSIITNVFPARERGKAIGVWAATAGLGGGARAADRRLPARALLLGLGVPREPAHRRRRARWPASSSSPTPRTPSAPRLDPVGARAVDRRSRHPAVRHHRGPQQRLDRPGDRRRLRWSRRCCSAPSRGGSSTASHPMLDFNFFRNPRFSAASAAITLTFFAMFGSLFLFSQYLQFVLGLHTAPDGRAAAGRRHPDDDHRPAVAALRPSRSARSTWSPRAWRSRPSR